MKAQVGLEGHILLLRAITIEPGGQIAKHSHEKVPGLVKVISGEWTEGSQSGEKVFNADTAPAIVEDEDTVNWFYNRGTEPATAIVCDIKPASLSAIEGIRDDARIPRDFRLKFNPRPENLSHDQFREVKQRIIEAAVAHDVGLITYLILHDICTSMGEARRNGINTVCYHFDCCLARLNSKGLVLIDRFNDEGNEIDAHLQEKFSIGVTGMPYSNEIRLSNILGLQYSAIGQSHFASLIDIVVSSMRWAMDQHTRGAEQNRDSARNLLALLSPLFVRRNGREEVSEFGLLFSSKVIRSARYREIYQSLKDFFAEAGIVVAQEITGERSY